jgi:hypothetical protein
MCDVKITRRRRTVGGSDLSKDVRRSARSHFIGESAHHSHTRNQRLSAASRSIVDGFVFNSMDHNHTCADPILVVKARSMRETQPLRIDDPGANALESRRHLTRMEDSGELPF